jgi:polyhydroxyalkanoate synthesis regulator phasin
MNNRLAQEAIRQAASRVKTGVRQGVDTLVEQETAPLRARIAELEARVDRLERRLGERSSDTFDRDAV